jgi:hypothetical protein
MIFKLCIVSYVGPCCAGGERPAGEQPRGAGHAERFVPGEELRERTPPARHFRHHHLPQRGALHPPQDRGQVSRTSVAYPRNHYHKLTCPELNTYMKRKPRRTEMV